MEVMRKRGWTTIPRQERLTKVSLHKEIVQAQKEVMEGVIANPVIL